MGNFTSQFMIDQAPLKKVILLQLHFDEEGLYRRAALGLLPEVQDPEANKPMKLSSRKSSRRFKFLEENKVTLSEGYRLCRATRYLPLPGSYFWEVSFSQKTNDSHVRIGIATVKAEMEGPVGMDSEGYCVRDRGGAYHNAKKSPSPEFSAGDILGFGFTSDETGASLHLWINGDYKGAIFTGIDPTKHWIPAVSIYRDATVQAVFHRPFEFEPGSDWTAAADVPDTPPDGKLTADKLAYWMRGKLEAGEDQEIAYKAILVAMTPPHQMPI